MQPWCTTPHVRLVKINHVITKCIYRYCHNRGVFLFTPLFLTRGLKMAIISQLIKFKYQP